MAISKIKPIRVTLNYAIDYIVNPLKTDGGRLVSSFGCSPKTADLEMAITASKGSNNGNRIAYHMIQSFAADDDITPEKAHELGMEFAKKVTGGRHEFVVSTHIDGNCIHNHIIFNAVNFVDYKKYDNTDKDLRRMRNVNDKICRENNLSVIEKYSGKRGKGKYEYEQSKAGNSWKDKLREMIDETIQKVSSFEEFLQVMELEGYEIKLGKYITFRAPGQKQGTRSKRIGPDYTEESIRRRIENKDLEKNGEHEKTENNSFSKKSETQKQTKNSSRTKQKSKINLIVDISKNVKAQQSKGYEHALVRANIDTLVQTMNYLISHDLKTPEDFEIHYNDMNAEYKFLTRSNKKISIELLDLSEKIKFTQNYKKNKSVYTQSLKARNRQEFYREHEQEIIEFKASMIYFERNKINPDSLNLSELFEEYRNVKGEKKENEESLKNMKSKMSDLDTIKNNIESLLDIKFDESNKKRTTEKEKENSKRDEHEKSE